jgi:hypothetical protein
MEMRPQVRRLWAFFLSLWIGPIEAAVDCTTLSLLTREAGLTVTFPMELTEAQYAKLYGCVAECDTKQALRDCIAIIANESAQTVTRGLFSRAFTEPL